MLGRSSTSNAPSNNIPNLNLQANGQGALTQVRATGSSQIINSSSGIGTSLQDGRVECLQGLDDELSSAVGTSSPQASATNAGTHDSTLSDLKSVIESGDVAAVRAIIGATADFSSLDPAGDSALILAAERGQAKIVGILRDAGARIGGANQGVASRSLRVAASEDSAAGVAAWVAAGVDINATNQNGATALMLASQRGHINAVRALIEAGAVLSVVNKQGETALTLAAEQGHVAVVRLLRISGAAITPSQELKSSQRLDGAIRSGAWQVAVAWYSTALQKLSAFASASPLSTVARGMRGSIGEMEVSMLVSGAFVAALGANRPAAEQDQLLLNTHLVFNAIAGRSELVGALRSSGAKIPSEFLASAGRALRDAAREGREAGVRAWLAAGADVDAANEDGWVALMYSTQLPNHSILSYLIAEGAELDLADKDGETALILSARTANFRAAEILLQHGASRELQDGQGRTAMNCAVEAGHVFVVEPLLRAGAQISRSDVHAVALRLTSDLPGVERSGFFLYGTAALSARRLGLPLLEARLKEMVLPVHESTVLHY
ncbi:ankyrin repeat domain-containing protein [Ottowia caeni]|uniref:ankyrin repeat domain-containing protein n=1 Tax=Ottowia caeni TaxID=2870339 RepID=UPI001E382575|nr:ankyrin repeat domain-containing protein [Ottowia caeni]